MNPVKRLVAQFRAAKRRVRKRWQSRHSRRAIHGSEYRSTEFGQLTRNYRKQADYQEFTLKLSLRNFASASAIAQRMDYGRLASKQKLVVLKAYYSSRFGALADSYLQILCDEILTCGQTNHRLVVGLIERVAISGFDGEYKLKLIETAKRLLDPQDPAEIVSYYALRWQEYCVTKDVVGDVDPINFIDVEQLNTFGSELAIKFLGSLKAFGHVKLV